MKLQSKSQIAGSGSTSFADKDAARKKAEVKAKMKKLMSIADIGFHEDVI